VWSFIRQAPTLPGGGVRVAEATSAVTPWPHQIRAFHRLYDQWPPKLLIADEVGLGKTIQAGLMLRQAWLAGRARRILILAPKAVCRQWQIELREKFNLNWPIYDGQKLNWYPSPALRRRHEKPVSKTEWHKEPVVIASSHLLRRSDRAKELLEAAEPWDLVVLDEAHHARRRAAGSAQEGGPNSLLRLMRGLKDRTQGLVLLTATPMQVHPVEIYDLLNLFGLPPEWGQAAFLQFFDDVLHENPSHEAFDRMAGMFRAIEAAYGPVQIEAVHRLGIQIPLRAKKSLAPCVTCPVSPGACCRPTIERWRCG
jgi:SNF2 family DNA or RNA helicase